MIGKMIEWNEVRLRGMAAIERDKTRRARLLSPYMQVISAKLKYCHSYRNASIGFSIAAFLAG